MQSTELQMNTGEDIISDNFFFYFIQHLRFKQRTYYVREVKQGWSSAYQMLMLLNNCFKGSKLLKTDCSKQI